MAWLGQAAAQSAGWGSLEIADIALTRDQAAVCVDDASKVASGVES